MRDRRVTIREIAEEVGISTFSAHSIMTEDLAMKRVPAKFVPKLLTAEQKQLRVAVSQDIAQFLAKFDAVALLQSFRHFPCKTDAATRALHTTSLKRCLPATDAIDRWEKIHTCTQRFKVGLCKRA
jgi:hypothetical protein